MMVPSRRNGLSNASIASSAAGELGFINQSPRQAPSVSEMLSLGLLPLYPRLPQFFDEAGKQAQYLAPDVARSQMRMLVDDAGCLVDRDRCLLSSEGQALAIFVMDRDGLILLTFDFAYAPESTADVTSSAPPPPPPAHHLRCHHSSMVAGAAVAAAGQMSVHNGRIISISNESGHYMPPPSCLRTLLARLEEMGVQSLGSVNVQGLQTPLTQNPDPHFDGQSSVMSQEGIQRPHISPARVRVRGTSEVLPQENSAVRARTRGGVRSSRAGSQRSHTMN